MSARATRWLLFAALVLALPVPMLGPFDTLVPAVRYAILLGAAGAVALVEGAAGPVPGLLALFAVNLALALAVAWVAAWAFVRLTGLLGDRLRQRLVLAAAGGLLAVATLFEIYATGFGRSPHANLPGVLW